MTMRVKQVKLREQKFKWSQIGMFGENRVCPVCEGTNIIQIYKHDAWVCIDCNEWLEEACDDLKCPYCSGRPETPYEVFGNTDFVAELIRTTIKMSPDIFIIRNQRTTYKSAYNFLEDMGYEEIHPIWEVSFW